MNDGLPERLTKIWDQIELACEVDKMSRIRKLNSAIGGLRLLVGVGYLPAWYVLGYAYYCHPNRRDPNSIERAQVVVCLETAVSNRVNESLANLFLAHHFYDIGDFAAAGRYAHKVGELEPWLLSKLWELLLYIQIRLRGIAQSHDAIEKYASQIESTGQSEPTPFNLFNALEACLPKEHCTVEVENALGRLDAVFPILSGHDFRDLIVDKGRNSSS